LNQSGALPLLKREIPTPRPPPAPSVTSSHNLIRPAPKTSSVSITNEEFDPFAEMDEALLSLDVEGKKFLQSELTVSQHWQILIAKVLILLQLFQWHLPSHTTKDLLIRVDNLPLKLRREDLGRLHLHHTPHSMPSTPTPIPRIMKMIS
jgi:hypothetical protein